jgi:HSP20 family molecular chaperone IbpA
MAHHFHSTKLYDPYSLFSVSSNTTTYPSPKAMKTDDGWVQEIILPGFTKEEIKITVEQDYFVVEAETERELPTTLNQKVTKTFLADDIDPESVIATLENGILKIMFSLTKQPGKVITVS